MNKVAIMGFGNPVRSDDAVGCYVIEELRKTKIGEDPNVTLLDMGTSAFEVLFSLKGHDQIIIIDGVINSDDTDGTLFKLPASEVKANIQDDPMVFLHSLKWDQALSYANKIMNDDFPEDNITVYLIAITNTKLEVEMSVEVKSAAERLVNIIVDDIYQNAS